ncbi:MAG: SUMF1/EgtB/PvdO family nonheme iron enzyme [Pseudomonadota bacterium]
MPAQLSMDEARHRIALVASASADDRLDVMKLFELAGLDPLSDFRFENWSGVSFRNQDLRECDFTGARLHGCDFTGAELTTAYGDDVASSVFDQAELGRVIHDPDRDPTLPGIVTPVANLREAADWDAYRRAWTRPERWPDDGHLPIGAIFQDAPFAPEMVVVPPGRYLRGSPDGEGEERERPQREVTIDYRSAVGRFPVTFEEWDFAIEAGGVEYKPDDEGWGRGRRPVINVSWNNIIESYLPWLNERLGLPAGSGYRLLTEAEWEYCCRAGTETAYSFGDAITRKQAQFNADKTAEVGNFPANAFGLHDLHGNVWEWCADAWHDDYECTPEDGSARDSEDANVFRGLRGGSWNLSPQYLRSADRNWIRPGDRNWSSGFRLARTLHP